MGRVNDKLERSRMVLRVISKEKDGLVLIEDETGKEKMVVRYGLVWVGMIALMEVSFSDGIYKLEKVLDLGEKEEMTHIEFKEQPKMAYRMLFVKGSFLNNQSLDSIGLKVLICELKTLREKERSRVNCVVIMGPLINSAHEVVTNSIDKTYEQEFVDQIKMIKDEVTGVADDIELVFMPSSDDLASFYPIPQPKY